MNKCITIENYKEFKPSEFIRSFISDIEVGVRLEKKTGKKVNMHMWEESSKFLPCLGGLACMNMGISPDIEPGNLGNVVSDLGDAIRLGNEYRITHLLFSIYNSIFYIDLKEHCNWEVEDFSRRSRRILIERINLIAEQLEKEKS